MCIISAFPKGTEKSNDYTKEFIKNGADCNQDGSGYMYKRNGEKTITVSKGFFNVTELIEAISKENLQVEDELVVHHRISTAGKTTKENCHPFVASKNHSEIAALNITTDKACLVHNGHFSSISKLQDLDRDFSDTYAFVRYIFSNKEIQRMFFENDDLFKILTDDIIKTSKLAVLSADKDLILYGHFIEEKGYFHSNSTYCAQKAYNYWNNYSDYDYRSRGGRFNNGSNNPGGTTSKNWSEGFGGNNDTKPIILLSEIKPKFLKLDNDIITITNFNCHHFKYVKKGAINLLDITNIEYGTMENFDPISATNTMRFTKDGVTGESFEAISTLAIYNKYYYYPKVTFLKMYQDYLDLTNEVKDVGKQTLKKLTYLLSKHVKTGAFDLIIYPKTGKCYQKNTLVLFEKLVQKEIDFKASQKPITMPSKLSNLLDGSDNPDILEEATEDQIDARQQNLLDRLGINM